MSKNPAIQKAIDELGGPVAAASAVGVKSYQTIQQWVINNRIPPKYCPTIERLTGIPLVDLCPDDWQWYWPELQEASHV